MESYTVHGVNELDDETVSRSLSSLLDVFIPLSVALFAERDLNRLLEMILRDAQQLCYADGGTLYWRTPENTLRFEIMRTDSLNVLLGGTSGRPVPFNPLPMYDRATGKPNYHNVATYTALTANSVNIPDAYHVEGFDFSGTRAFDAANGYHSTSFLTVPLKGQSGDVIGVLQLINARNPKTGDILPFAPNRQRIVESLSALAAVALEAYQREQKLKEQLLELQIVIDKAKQSYQVAEITETEYFQQLQQKVRALRSRISPDQHA